MSKRKLLLADDSITIQKVVNLTFADEGIEVISVGDGNLAMDKLREDFPDLVMADVNMPGLNGYEICEKIKQDGTNGKTPVILLVGSFEPFDEDEAKRVGADDYLTKPFQSINQLVEKVSELLELDEEKLEDTAKKPIENGEFADSVNDFTPVPDTFHEPVEDLGLVDDNFDDEMIQTDQVGSLPIAESVKFESTTELPQIQEEEFVFEKTNGTDSVSTDVTIESDQSAEQGISSDFTEESSYSIENDLHRTQPLTNSDYEELSIEQGIGESEIEARNGINDSEVIDLEETNDSESLEDVKEDSVVFPMPDAVSVLELDELNLLELPPLEGEDEGVVDFDSEGDLDTSLDPDSLGASDAILEDETNEVESVDRYRLDDSSEAVETSQETDASEVVETSQDLSFADSLAVEKSVETIKSTIAASDIDIAVDKAVTPEMVEVITKKVVERLSERAVRDIAWEVVPQLADLIIKKMAEDKMKD